MKHIGIYGGVLTALAFPTVLFAQTSGAPVGVWQTLIGIEDYSKVFELLSLWSTLIVAIVTTAMVWIGGQKMRGGIFGNVLTFFSIGMTCILGAIAVGLPWLAGIPGVYLTSARGSLYIIGFIFMGVAANKLLKVTRGE